MLLRMFFNRLKLPDIGVLSCFTVVLCTCFIQIRMNVQLENMTVSRSVSTYLDHTCVGVMLAISWVQMDIHVKVSCVAL